MTFWCGCLGNNNIRLVNFNDYANLTNKDTQKYFKINYHKFEIVNVYLQNHTETLHETLYNQSQKCWYIYCLPYNFLTGHCFATVFLCHVFWSTLSRFIEDIIKYWMIYSGNICIWYAFKGKENFEDYISRNQTTIKPITRAFIII